MTALVEGLSRAASSRDIDTIRALCHDLRQPLAAILLLSDSGNGDVDRKMEVITDQARWLSQLVDTVLTDAATDTVQPVDVAELAAEAEVWRRTRTIVKHIAEGALEAMKEPGSAGKTVVLDVVGALAAAAALIFTDGAAATLLSVGGTSIRTASALAKASPPHESDHKVEGDTPEQILTNLKKGLADTNQGVIDAEDKIWSCCNQLASDMGLTHKSQITGSTVSDFDLLKPSIIDDDDPDHYPQGGVLKVEMDTIRRVGQVYLPGLADVFTRLETARRQLPRPAADRMTILPHEDHVFGCRHRHDDNGPGMPDDFGVHRAALRQRDRLDHDVEDAPLVDLADGGWNDRFAHG